MCKVKHTASLIAAVALSVATIVHADVPNWCKTLGVEAAANSPSCQERTGPCALLSSEAVRLYADWMNGAAFQTAARYGRKLSVRSVWGSNV